MEDIPRGRSQFTSDFFGDGGSGGRGGRWMGGGLFQHVIVVVLLVIPPLRVILIFPSQSWIPPLERSGMRKGIYPGGWMDGGHARTREQHYVFLYYHDYYILLRYHYRCGRQQTMVDVWTGEGHSDCT